MAIYTKISVGENDSTWYLVSPKTLRELITLAWYLWKYPNKVAALIGINKESEVSFKSRLKPLTEFKE